jgi:hypothetical protein
MSHNTPPTVRHIVDLDAIKTPLGSQYWGVIKKYFNVIYAHIIYIKKSATTCSCLLHYRCT